MQKGFTFKGIHSSEFGVSMRSQSRPVVPEVKKTQYSALLMDGAYDFSCANPYNREFYNNRTFRIQMYLNAKDLSGLNKKMAEIASWLTGCGDLIFDDTPLVKWKAYRKSEIAYAPELSGKKAILSVEFDVSAFGYSVWRSSEDVELCRDVLLDTNIPLDMASGYIYRFENLGAGEQVTMNIINYGDRPVRPIIRIETQSQDFAIYGTTLICNGTECGCSAHGYLFIYDFKKRQVVGDITNPNDNPYHKMLGFSGEFSELMPGNNELKFSFTGPVSRTVTVTVDFEGETMWDFNFDKTDWGDSDASII